MSAYAMARLQAAREAGVTKLPRPERCTLVRIYWERLAELGEVADDTEASLRAFIYESRGRLAPEFLPDAQLSGLCDYLWDWVKNGEYARLSRGASEEEL